jgi:hypothetical protein
MIEALAACAGGRRCVLPCILAATFLLLTLSTEPVAAKELPCEGNLSGCAHGGDKVSPAAESCPSGSDAERRWFLMFAMVNSYPLLESEDFVYDLFNPAMRFLAPGFDNVDTVGTLRDDHILWVPYLGIGRKMSKRWTLFFQGGYAAGKVRTKADDISLLLLPLHTDFEIQRGSLYFGPGVDFFPWGLPEQRDYDGVMDRLRNTRLCVGTRVMWTYATYRAKVKAGLKPFPNILNLELDDSWFIPSVNINVGADIPLNKQSSFFVNAGYNYFDTQDFDFEGPSYTVGLKWFFR